MWSTNDGKLDNMQKKYPNFYCFFCFVFNKIAFFWVKLWKNGNCAAIFCRGRVLKGEITYPGSVAWQSHCEKLRNSSLKNCQKKPPRTVLVKMRFSPNGIVILQDIALEVDSVWVVPVGHTHSRVTWPKIWFQDWKMSFLGRFKVASWPVLHWLFFLKINSANCFCHNDLGPQGDMKRGWGGVRWW